MDNGIIHTYFCFWHRVRVVNETAAIDVWRLRWYNFYIRTHISAGGEVQPPFLEASKSNDDKLIVSHEEASFYGFTLLRHKLRDLCHFSLSLTTRC